MGASFRIFETFKKTKSDITEGRFPKKHSQSYLVEKIDRDAANRFIRKSKNLATTG